MISYRETLRKTGITEGVILNFPSGYYNFPRSFRQALFAMNSPEPSKWFKKYEDEKSENYTNRCNGVATDGKFWYFSSNDPDREEKGIYKVDFSYNVIGNMLKLESSGSDHIGALCCYQGNLYVACENPQQILIIDTSTFDSFTQHRILGTTGEVSPQRDKLAWCAIHPWNGFLYSSLSGDEGGVSHDSSGIIKTVVDLVTGNINEVASLTTKKPVTEVFGYEFREGNFYNVPSATIHLKRPIGKVQGGAFTKNGNLLLSDDEGNEIKCYSSLTGHFWGGTAVQVNRSFETYEEMQGLCVSEGLSIEGLPTQIHLILLDVDLSGDEFFHKHYTVPLEYAPFL